MTPPTPRPVVHLELHTPNLARACAFYSRACGWRVERVPLAGRCYDALDWGGEIGGGVVECAGEQALWLPYLQVACVGEATERARRLGATVLLEPRDGPPGGAASSRSATGARSHSGSPGRRAMDLARVAGLSSRTP